MAHRISLWLLMAMVCGNAGAWAEVQVSVYPERVHLSSATEPQRLLVVTRDERGFTHDVSDEASLEFDAEVLTADGTTLWAKQSGETSITVDLRGVRMNIPVTVTGVDGTDRPVGFNRDVMPVLTRAGCNTGTCHGSARGQDKFRLSLFGFDPAGDYYRITREQTSRRLNLALPDESLILLKATGAVPHSGGKRFEADSPYYLTIRQWIEQGAVNHDAEAAVVDRIELFPPEAVLATDGGAQPLLVLAHYADGSQRDVTRFAVFISVDDKVASVDDQGVLHPVSRGESFITARFDKHTVGMNSVVLPHEDPFQASPAEGNYIDDLITDKLNKLHLRPAPLCSDAEFLRRACIDLRGLLPTESEYEQFIADESPDKREQLIDQLLAGDEFADLWTTMWSDLLLVRSIPNVFSEKAVVKYYEWLRDSIKQGVPFDQLVYDLLTASGTTFHEPAVGFYTAERDKLKIAENVAQSFLGIRMQCAKCHNHPFDRWTMDDYYGFAAFFAQVGRKQGEDYRDTAIFRGGGQTKHPVTGQNVMPKFLGGEQPEIKGRDRREVVAEWIVNQSPYFAQTTANRLWARLFGQGIVEPADDVRISNPPVNAALYDALGAKLIEYDFDIRRLARDIATSRAYQRAANLPEATPDEARVVAQNFGKARYRRISATSLLDCVAQVTEAPSVFAGVPVGSRAAQLSDPGASDYFLKTFGRSDRTSVCACGSTTEPTLAQALHLLNGQTVHRKIKQGRVVARMAEAGKTPAEILTSLYVRCLSRPPTGDELEALTSAVTAQESTQRALEDAFWAVLNSREFVFNH